MRISLCSVVEETVAGPRIGSGAWTSLEQAPKDALGTLQDYHMHSSQTKTRGEWKSHAIRTPASRLAQLHTFYNRQAHVRLPPSPQVTPSRPTIPAWAAGMSG